MPNDVGALTQLLNAFVGILYAGEGKVVPHAYYLFSVMAVIEIVFFGLWVAAGHSDLLKDGVSKIIVMGFIVFLITTWTAFLKPIVNSLIEIGILVGGSGINFEDFSNPSTIAAYGFECTKPLLDYLGKISWYQIGDNIIYSITYWVIILIFCIIAIQVFLAHVEFWIVSMLGLILLPFYVFEKMKWLAEGAMKSIIGQGVRLMTLACIIGMALPVMKNLQLPTDPTIAQSISMLAAIATIMAFARSAPQIAASLVSGHPSATGAGAVLGVAAATGYAMKSILTPIISSLSQQSGDRSKISDLSAATSVTKEKTRNKEG